MSRIKVGTIRGASNNMKVEGYTTIKSLTASTPYGAIGPYVLRYHPKREELAEYDDTVAGELMQRGIIFENWWQFLKVYQDVPQSRQYQSRWSDVIIWEHPAEHHVDDDGHILPAYYQWRLKGFRNTHPVRYPIGIQHRHETLCHRYKGEILDYVPARKRIYLPGMLQCLSASPMFVKLRERYQKGEKMLVIEVDGPKMEHQLYYQQRCNLQLTNPIDITLAVLRIMLNDTRAAFGHGYCIATALLASQDPTLVEQMLE